MKIKYRKIISIILIICLSIPTLVGSLTFAGSKGIKLAGLSEYISNPKVNYIDLYSKKRTGANIQPPKDIKIQVGSKAPIYSDERISDNELKEAKSQDVYNLSKKDIEELVSKGFSIEEILEADAIGNNILENPKEVLEQKRITNKDLDKVKKDLINKKNKAILEKLTKKYPEDAKELSKAKISDTEKLNKLIQKDVYGINTKSGFSAQYISSEDDEIRNLEATDEVKKNGKIKVYEKQELSKAYKDKYALSDVESEGLTDYLIQKLENIADMQGKSKDELVVNGKI